MYMLEQATVLLLQIHYLRWVFSVLERINETQLANLKSDEYKNYVFPLITPIPITRKSYIIVYPNLT